MNDLYNLFVTQLRRTYNGERELVRTFSLLAKRARSEKLKDAFLNHLEETKRHVNRLETLFGSLKEEPHGAACTTTKALADEAEALYRENADDTSVDAALIAGGQKIEHYQIATYGCLQQWARTLALHSVDDTLHEILEEEKAADRKLSQLAVEGLNQSAVAGKHSMSLFH
ncbi:MAG TPA: DUF892 family protein [Candidatus Limnocylindria bacterium]|jgi:ferritin-like metal-binding protein YciE|nr:DUF892 family protein [Candidatus Limnocylindria bacterium]